MVIRKSFKGKKDTSMPFSVKFKVHAFLKQLILKSIKEY